MCATHGLVRISIFWSQFSVRYTFDLLGRSIMSCWVKSERMRSKSIPKELLITIIVCFYSSEIYIWHLCKWCKVICRKCLPLDEKRFIHAFKFQVTSYWKRVCARKRVEIKRVVSPQNFSRVITLFKLAETQVTCYIWLSTTHKLQWSNISAKKNI